MQQTTFSDIEYSNRRRKTRRESFLDSMDALIPWDQWVGRIRPFYPAGRRGRPPRDIEKMLRMFLIQNWYGLSDKGTEHAIFDSYAMRKFMHLDFLDEQVPGATTLLKFRHLLEEHQLGEELLQDVADRIKEAGLIFHGGTLIDACVTAAPSAGKKEE